MRSTQPEQRKTRSEGQAPWWSKYAAQIVVGLILAAASGLFGLLFTQLGTDTPGVRCNTSSDPIRDYRGREFNLRYYCSTSARSAIYANVSASQAAQPLDDTGYINQSSSVWVICQLQGRLNPVIKGRTNTVWLYTQADHARSDTYGYGSWGYLPATVVTQGGSDAPVPGVPICPEYY